MIKKRLQSYSTIKDHERGKKIRIYFLKIHFFFLQKNSISALATLTQDFTGWANYQINFFFVFE
jgi:hypothetical protein